MNSHYRAGDNKAFSGVEVDYLFLAYNAVQKTYGGSSRRNRGQRPLSVQWMTLEGGLSVQTMGRAVAA